MDYKLTKLPSGLRVIFTPMESSESSTLTIWVKTGSRNEDKKVSGISHFLEHMVFKGSAKRPTAREISEIVDAIGGEFNAATSKDWTNFYIKARNANLETAFDILSDMVLNPVLKEEEIEREKGTIIQEIKMYEDTPIMRIGDVFEELAFEGNPLGWDTAGTPGSVSGIKRGDFIKYRAVHYHPENILVTVAGGVPEGKVLELVKKYFSRLASFKGETFQGQKFEAKHDGPKIKVKNKKSDQAHFILGFMAEGRGYSGRYAQGVLSAILGGGMSSRLFIEIRERRGLAYSVRTSVDRYQEVGYFGTYAGVDPAKAEEAISVMLEEHYKISNLKSQISNRELTKAKEFLKGHLALALEDTKEVTTFFGEQELFLKEVLTPEQIYKNIDAVTLEDVYAEAKKLFNKDRLNLAVIGPYTNDGDFKKLLR